MKKGFFAVSLALVALMMTGCITLIESVASTYPNTPAPKPQPVVVTTVTKPTTPKQQTTIVVKETYDYYRQLDLRAVGAAFAQSRSVREFEELLNSGRYMVSNLDLNRDGWIDYLRVMETMQGYTHVLYIQAVLGFNMFQNVATVIVDAYPGQRYVQIVGDPYIYGPNFYVDPVFRTTPPMYSYMSGYNYSCWSSPYTWDFFPSYYTKPKPVYQTHYDAYVTTYLSSHTYCREVHYTTTVHNTQFSTIGASTARHDYANSNPDRAFRANNKETNAAALLQAPTRGVTNESTSTTTTAKTPSTTKTSTTTAPVRQQAATTPSTTISTRVQNSGRTSTTVRRIDEAGNTTTTTTRVSGNTSRVTETTTRASEPPRTSSTSVSGGGTAPTRK